VARQRVYLPSTLPRLKAALAEGTFGPAPLTACAVTPELREWYVDDELEELEYVALTEAARVSLRLLDAELVRDPGAPARRVVLAADVEAGEVTRSGAGREAGDRATVTLLTAVPLASVVSAHVDDAEAEGSVAAAAAAVVAAELGNEDARFALDEAEGHELLWWHPSEFELLVLDLG